MKIVIALCIQHYFRESEERRAFPLQNGIITGVFVISDNMIAHI